MNDVDQRRERHSTDDRGRQTINAHGDVDVVRTRKSDYPVQLPVEPGDVVEIDGKREVFVGFRGDGLILQPPNRDGGARVVEGVHSFNTRVRNADRIVVEPRDDE